MKKLLLGLVMGFIFSLNAYPQEKHRTIYIKTISTKIKPYSNAVLSFQGCNHAVIQETPVAYPGFRAYDFSCDSLQFASRITFDVTTNNPLIFKSFKPAKGDLQYVDGDSIIVDFDKEEAIIINKNRLSRRK